MAERRRNDRAPIPHSDEARDSQMYAQDMALTRMTFTALKPLGKAGKHAADGPIGSPERLSLPMLRLVSVNAPLRFLMRLQTDSSWRQALFHGAPLGMAMEPCRSIALHFWKFAISAASAS